MIEEVTSPIPITPPKISLAKRRYRSLIFAIGLPILTISVIWLTTEKDNSKEIKKSSVEVNKNKTPTFDPSTLPIEIHSYFNGELDTAENEWLNKFYKDPFGNDSKRCEEIAKDIHQIKMVTSKFLDLFSKEDVKEGANQFRALKALDSKIRQQFKLPFIGAWSQQINRWESEIDRYAQRAFLEGYALLRSSPREALNRYKLAIYLSGEDSKIRKKAQDAIRGLGLGLD